MPPRRKLPLIAERSIGDMQTLRLESALRFEQKIRDDKTVMCSAGCASCCYHPVRISILEGITLYQHLVEHGKWTPSFKAKLVETANLTMGLSMGIWLLSHIPCPLLTDKNRCSAYEARPFNCRTILSIGDPYNCHPHRIEHGSGIVSRIVPLEAFHREEAALLKRHGLRHFLMVIPQAILLAERVMSGELDIEGVDREFVAEYKENANG